MINQYNTRFDRGCGPVRSVINLSQVLAIILLLEMITGCSPNDSKPIPAGIKDFRATIVTPDGALLEWTAPDEVDGAEPGYYKMCYSTTPLKTGEDWIKAEPIDDPPIPLAPGTRQKYGLTGLEPGTNYWVGIYVVGRNHLHSEYYRSAAITTGDTTTLGDYTLIDIDDSSHSSGEWLGHRLVLLNFWGVWCHYCVEEIPDLIQLHDTYADSDVVLIGLDWGDDNPNLKYFVTTNDMAWLNVFAVREILMQYQIPGYPTTIFLGPDGREVGRRVGKGSFDTYQSAVEYLLEKVEPPAQ
ncbi:MAG TPA: thioredoxin-like domain-containing protein [candidate division Zixibacteria bacterium]|nr:thioredoxin-like domain-containing protein [candidate division Zixibacteria bacterium]